MKKTEKSLPAGEFKTHCLRIMEVVRRSKKSVLVTKRGKPLVRLIPVDTKPTRLFGCMKGTLEICGDLIAPTEAIWKANAD